VPALTIHRAESELATSTATVDELAVRKERLVREVNSLKRMREAFRAGQPWQGARELTEAEANMKTALTRAGQAQVAVEVARLRLERVTVRAPVAGRVLALIARPGMRVMGLAPRTSDDASTVRSRS